MKGQSSRNNLTLVRVHSLELTSGGRAEVSSQKTVQTHHCTGSGVHSVTEHGPSSCPLSVPLPAQNHLPSTSEALMLAGPSANMEVIGLGEHQATHSKSELG